jgi:hypothetical protein
VIIITIVGEKILGINGHLRGAESKEGQLCVHAVAVLKLSEA